jgi:putative SOS response-associated peptidase YedK
LKIKLSLFQEIKYYTYNMCGRFTIAFDIDDLSDELGIAEIPVDWQPRYNVAPSQPVLAVTDASTRKAEWLRWGLIPSWAKDASIGNKLINARAETIDEKPSFRNAFHKRRCLILADGFYEWQKPASGRGKTQPYYFRLKNGEPFAFAGLWEVWKPQPDVEPVKTCTIITTQANAVVTPVHERMPVILTKEHAWEWILSGQAVELQKMLAPLDPVLMTAYPVGAFVSNPAVESKVCVEPLLNLL